MAHSSTLIDELIKLHKSLVSTISELDLALVGTLKEVNNVLSDQRGLVFALKVFQKNLLWSLESLNTQTQSYCIELAQRMESATKSVLTRLNLVVQDTIKDTEWHLAGLRSVSFSIEIAFFFSYKPSLILPSFLRISKSLAQRLLTWREQSSGFLKTLYEQTRS